MARHSGTLVELTVSAIAVKMMGDAAVHGIPIIIVCSSKVVPILGVGKGMPNTNEEDSTIPLNCLIFSLHWSQMRIAMFQILTMNEFHFRYQKCLTSEKLLGHNFLKQLNAIINLVHCCLQELKIPVFWSDPLFPVELSHIH